MTEDKKPVEENQQPPEGGQGNPQSVPNQSPSAEELQKKNDELQNQMKERDAKIQDLETIRATIEARQRQVDDANTKAKTDEGLRDRIKTINDRRAYDPDGADTEMATLLSEVQSKAAQTAVQQAQAAMTQQTTIQKLKNGVKSANPDFDDDVVDVIMERANSFATTGKYRTAEEAIKAATDFVKAKFEGYAQKKNAIPPLPEGASAEGGGANNPPTPPPPNKVLSPLDELEAANDAKSKRSFL